MKIKEEIEQLAKQSNDERGIDSAKSMLEREYVLGYTNAYTQCQEDMADKRYTEDDMLKFANQYSSINILHLKEHLKEFTLNKQD